MDMLGSHKEDLEMSPSRFILLSALVALMASSQQNSSKQQSTETKFAPPISCPITPRPTAAFIPPAPYPTELPEKAFWIGTEKLWTDIGEPMVWTWRPHQPGHEQDLTAKVFWFRVGYDYHTEPIPKLEVTGARLDESAPALQTPQGKATNAILGGGTSSMLTGVYVPTPGCWEITGDYQGDKLSFVVWVEPAK
jgi:hypothetical protein